MNILFLVSFIGGLLLAVWIMIAGVERPREADPSGERTFRLSPPVVAVFGIIFGVVGYILFQRQLGSTATQAGIAAALAAVAAGVTARLVRDWWKVTPEHETDDERFVLQGHVARVTKPIGAGVDGEVAFEVGTKQYVLPARGLDGSAIAVGLEAVIERIEDGIVYVESWAEVEKRL